VSGDRNLSASSTSSVAIGFNQRTIAVLLAAVVGLATFVLLLMGGGGGVSTAYAQDTKPITAQALTDHECDSTEWHFLINQIDSEANAPGSISVVWANGGSEAVPLDKFTGKTAHYATTSNLDSTVVSATAQIYTGWSGQFNLSHGPCGGPTPSETPTETPSEKPTETPSETPSEKPTETPSETPSEKPTETPSEQPTETPSETPSEKPTETPSETPSETPTESPKPSVSVETPAPVPTEVPAGADAAGGGGSAAGLLGLAVVTGGAVAGTAVIARRRFLHDS
jgi:hypothetical protein